VTRIYRWVFAFTHDHRWIAELQKQVRRQAKALDNQRVLLESAAIVRARLEREVHRAEQERDRLAERVRELELVLAAVGQSYMEGYQ
jgi:hypothetical protein